jgi:hypothetical protein
MKPKRNDQRKEMSRMVKVPVVMVIGYFGLLAFYTVPILLLTVVSRFSAPSN